MTNENTEFFSSRMGLILAGIGMAVGTGNIWRFPRIAGKNGGSAFLIAWLIALFVWSIPLMIAEMHLGRKTRKGPLGAFGAVSKYKYTWMGGWIVFVTSAIMFYYSVVAGWCLRYLTYFLAGMGPSSSQEAAQLWKTFSTTPWQTALFHIISIVFAAGIVVRGVQQGIEKANKYLLPGLFIMLTLLGIRALTLDGAWQGVTYLFHFDSSKLADATTWLEAFSQSAWSTGAAWGLLLAFAVCAKKEDSAPASDCLLIGFSNNLASMLAAIVVIPTVFALSSTQADAVGILNQGNTGLAFTSLASLFSKISYGSLAGTVFFLALFTAATTSLISMVELAARTLIDFGFDRKKAVITVTILTIFFGIPSAVSMKFFNNQDWVWGVGLLVSGLFTAVIVSIHSVKEMAQEIFASESAIDSWLWQTSIRYTVPISFFLLTGWWLYQGTGYEKIPWWQPFAQWTPGTVLLQWLIAGTALYLLNEKMGNAVQEKNRAEGD